MIRNLKIGPRLLILIGVPLLCLLAVGVSVLVVLENATQTEIKLKELVADQVKINRLSEVVQVDLRKVVVDPYLGSITWASASARLSAAETRLETIWDEYLAGFSNDEINVLRKAYSDSLDGIRKVYEEAGIAVKEHDRNRLFLLLANDYEFLTAPYFNALAERGAQLQAESEKAFQKALDQTRWFYFGTIIIVLLGTLVAVGLGQVIYRSILRPISRISDTVRAVSDGDYSVRTRLEGQDELGELGDAFDRLLEDKVTALAIAEAENEQLNNSIIELIRSVAEIGNKDFTIKIPVKEDVTGAIGDSLNLLTRETSAVLNRIQKISQDVAKVSNRVKQQSDKVISLAQTERMQVQAAAKGLEESAQTMRSISRDAEAANEKAGSAMGNTQIALESVNHTVQGINNIRDTIGEAEKRIKRLGERSQEITGIVNLINSIAERTHILALNASMHAASAGEAGRGFAVVANEVQRLAENAREATSEISTLVNNIRVETVDTVSTMNTVISQVSEGTRLAEQAGENMQQTKLSTSELVASVQQIAESSQDQSDTSIVLRDRANEIEVSTRETAENLQQQTIYTDRLVKFSEMLVKSVEIFRLPPAEQQVSEDDNMEEAIAIVDAAILEPQDSMQKAV